MNRISIAALLFLALCSRLALAGAIITGGSEGNNTSNGFSNGFVSGYEFTVNESGLAIVALGFWDEGSDGLPGSHDVGLWQNSDESLLASAAIDDSDALDSSVIVAGGSWRYESLTTPVALQVGSTYTLGFLIPAPLSSTDALSLPLTTLQSDSRISIASTSRSLRTNTLEFPTGAVTTATAIRGNPNAMISQVSAVPEPSTACVLVIGIGGLAIARRRKPMSSSRRRTSPGV